MHVQAQQPRHALRAALALLTLALSLSLIAAVTSGRDNGDSDGARALATKGKCTATSRRLSSECGGVCASHYPCLVYNASVTCDDCDVDDDEVCEYFCVKYGSFPSLEQFVLLVPFSSYESEEEEEARETNSGYDDEVDAMGDDTNEYYHISNSAVTRVGALTLDDATTQFTLVGGSSVTDTVKSKVAKLTFDDLEFISQQTSVVNVTIHSFDLLAIVDDLGDMLPATMTHLDLVNTLLSSFPGHLASFDELDTLRLDKNYIEVVNTSDAIESLVTLSLNDNSLTSFDAVFPKLRTLHLESNNLTEIPAAVFNHTKLTTLSLSGNPLRNASFTSDQADFLENLSSLDLELTDFDLSFNCSASDLRVVHSLTVCISDGESDRFVTSTSDDDSGGSADAVMIGVGSAAALVLCAAAVGWWRRRKRKMTDKELLANGTGATALTGHTNGTFLTGYVPLWNDPEMLELQVRADDIEDVKKIGGGAYGVVWLVKYRKRQLLASKRISRDQANRRRTRDFVDEIKLVSQLEHPNIVQFVGAAWTTETDLQALFEYMERGDLRDYLVDPTTSQAWNMEKFQIAVDIIEGLVYVHSFAPPLLHRDLKSRNVLLSGEDVQAKLTDFGSSRRRSVQNTMTRGVGTARWLAPEVLSGTQDYTESADIYSFGVLLSELDTHNIPFDNMRGPNGNKLADVAILQMVAVGSLRPMFGPSCPNKLRDLADRCMAQNADERPLAPEVAYLLRTIQKNAQPNL